MTKIPRTVDRVVLLKRRELCHIDGREPFAAIVAHVSATRSVNLAVSDGNGMSHSRTGVRLYRKARPSRTPAISAPDASQAGQAARARSQELLLKIRI